MFLFTVLLGVGLIIHGSSYPQLAMDMDSSILALTTTFQVFAKLKMHRLTMHPAWWKLKILLFHLIMITQYLCKTSWNWVKNELVFLTFLTMAPVKCQLQPVAYSLGIILGVLGSLSQEMLYTVIRFKYYEPVHEPPWNYCPIINIQYVKMSQPLPERYLVFSGVRLKQEFVGLLQKFGYFLLTFLKQMDRLGLDKILF